MATHSSVLAWRIPQTEAGRVVHGVAKSRTQLKRLSMCTRSSLSTHTHHIQYECEIHRIMGLPIIAQTVKSLPAMKVTHVRSLGREFLPGESPGQRSLVDYSLWGHKET